MKQRIGGLFAGRGIHLPSLKVTLLTVLGAFVAGVAVAWITTLLPGWIAALNAPPGNPDDHITATPVPDPSVSVPPLEPLFRDLNDDDRRAGLTSLSYEYIGTGVFEVAPGVEAADVGGPPTRWVSVAVEQGLDSVDPELFAEFVMEALNDPRGWGANGRLQFARTDGVADFRVVLASPYTTAATCPDAHILGPEPIAEEVVATAASVDDAMPSPITPSPSPSEPQAPSCAEQSMIMISLFDWAAGVPAFASERTDSRIYQVLHGVGHLMVEPDVACASGRASVMVDHSQLPEACTPNPWPFPDAIDAETDGDDP